MSEMPVVVLDPGHGGPRATRNRGSSWNRAEGPNGLLEKNVAFDLALRVAARLRDHARVELTRTEQTNPSLSERSEVARRANAALFLSLHLNGSNDPDADGTDVYVAHDAGAQARAFADGVWRRLRAVTRTTHGGLGARDLGTLVTSRHSPLTAACLAEIAYLTNPRQAGALAEEGYRNQIADAISEAIREHLAPRAVAQELSVGDGSPFVREAVTQCWAKCQQLRLDASAASAPNRVAAQRIRTESGVTVDANPYAGIGQNEIEAIIRAGFTSHAMPEVLLAIWAKEGSTRSVTTAVPVPQATSDANARAIFRSKVYYEDLGADHFLVTTRAGSGTDNVFDDSDAAAPRHETHFAQRVAQLVTDGFLQENIAGAINAELTVSQVGGHRAVLPSTRFYALSLLLVDALWAKFKAATRPLLPSISDPMNYIQWNMGAASFDAFLRSAESHRATRTIEQWALHTTPDPHQYKQPRVNAIKFAHYVESYQPVFANWLNLIKPGIEDLRPDAHAAEIEVESLAIPTFSRVELFTPPLEPVAMPICIDKVAPRVFGSASMTVDRKATEAAVRAAFPGTMVVPDHAAPATKFWEIPIGDAIFRSGFFRSSGGTVQAVLESVICYPADPAHPANLAPSSHRFPVAIVVHGNHDAISSWNATATGPAATNSSGQTLTPGNPTAAFQIPSFLGYCSRGTINHGTPYLQEELAKFGFVSMSINTNGANMLNLLLTMRAEYIMQHLDQLRRFDSTPGHFLKDKLDLNRVALIGHSRGGDAVVKALNINAGRPAFNAAHPAGTRFGIRSVVSISPTDFTGFLRTAEQLAVEVRHDALFSVVYGSHDADVRGGGDGSHNLVASGFRMYDRSNTHRSMVFIHGANHNGFNREWPDEVNSSAPPVGRGDQETLAKEYAGGWLRYSMLSDWPEQGLFNGSRRNSRSVPVSLMWKFGRDLKTIERFQDTVPTTNTLAGAVASPPYVGEVKIDTENPVDPTASSGGCLLPSGTPCHLPTFPHVDRVAKASPIVAPRRPLREEIPATHRDFSQFTHLTFRVTKKYPIASAGAIAGAAFPDLSVTLEDTAGHRKTVPAADIYADNTLKVKPYFRLLDDSGVTNRNLTKCNLETWRIPLTRFGTGTGAVSLTGIRAVELDINAAAGEPVYVDTISVVKL